MSLPHGHGLHRHIGGRRHSRLALLTEVILALLAFSLTFLIITTFLVTGFRIPSTSMSPTLSVGDTVLVWRPHQLNGGLQRGQVVVFQDPGGWVTGDTDNSQYVIKRIIGLPGDRITCCNALGQLQINGAAISEGYLPANAAPSNTPFDVRVPEGSLFVLGDNRAKSDDSRYQKVQFVPVKRVVGVAFATYWPKLAGLPDHAGDFGGVPNP